MENAEALAEAIWPLAVTYGTRVVGVLILLVISWIVAGSMSRLVRRALDRSRLDASLSHFASRLAYWSILLMAMLACLSAFGIQTTSFAAVIGAAGLAIGLAFQGTLSNFAAGIMLLVFRPFKIGDFVKIGGTAGTVQMIDLFSTALDAPDNCRVIVPNRDVFGSTIENVTHNSWRRVQVEVGVDYAADIDRTRAVLERAAASVGGQLEDKEAQVVLDGLGASSVDWAVRVFCSTSDFLNVKQATTRAVKLALDEAGIGIPYPHMEVNLRRSDDVAA